MKGPEAPFQKILQGGKPGQFCRHFQHAHGVVYKGFEDNRIEVIAQPLHQRDLMHSEVVIVATPVSFGVGLRRDPVFYAQIADEHVQQGKIKFRAQSIEFGSIGCD